MLLCAHRDLKTHSHTWRQSSNFGLLRDIGHDKAMGGRNDPPEGKAVHNLSIISITQTCIHKHHLCNARHLFLSLTFSLIMFAAHFPSRTHFNTQMRCTVEQIAAHLDLGRCGKAFGKAGVARLSDGNVRICI